MKVDGSINQPGGTVELFGSSFNNTPGASISAGTIILAPSSSNIPITLVGTGGTASGFAVSSSFLNNLSTNILEIGSWSNNAGISLSGNLHFGVPSSNTIYAITTGDYIG